MAKLKLNEDGEIVGPLPRGAVIRPDGTILTGAALGKFMRVLRRRDLAEVWWVADKRFVKMGFRPKCHKLLRDLATATEEEIEAAKKYGRRLTLEHQVFPLGGPNKTPPKPPKPKWMPRAPEESITHENLLRFVTYEKGTGEFFWNESTKALGDRVGFRAGMINKESGYVVIGFGRKTYLAHRLAWFYVYGEWPKGVIDHIDRDRSNNRISNLRDVSQAENTRGVQNPSPFPAEYYQRKRDAERETRPKGRREDARTVIRAVLTWVKSSDASVPPDLLARLRSAAS